MLQGLEATDHRLDASAHRFVFLQQVGALGGEVVLTLAQGAILLAQGAEQREHLVELFLETFDLGVEAGGRIGCSGLHKQNYRPAITGVHGRRA